MKKPYLYAFAAIGFWSTTATVSKLLLHSFTTIQMLAVCSAVAAAFLLTVNLATGKLRLLKTYRLRDYLVTAGVGLLGTFFYNMFLVFGIDRLLASQAMIINYLWPMMAVIAGCVLLKEKITVRKALAVAMSFLGVVIVTSNGQLSGLAGGNLLGAGFCVLAALSYGLFVVLNKRLPYASSVSMMLYYIVSTLVAVTCVLVSGDLPELKGMQSLGLLWIGLGDYAIAYVSWALAMKAGQTAKIANLAYITPFLSLLVAHFVLGDPLTVWSIGGLAVIVAGIFLQLKDAK